MGNASRARSRSELLGRMGSTASAGASESEIRCSVPVTAPATIAHRTRAEGPYTSWRATSHTSTSAEHDSGPYIRAVRAVAISQSHSAISRPTRSATAGPNASRASAHATPTAAVESSAPGSRTAHSLSPNTRTEAATR